MFARFWQTFRLGLLTFVFIALGAYLAVTTPWSRVFGPAPNYAATVAEGESIVAAIYRFRAATDLWPEYLDDLVPTYLAKPVAPTWYYTLTADGPSLATTPNAAGTHVGYTFDRSDPEWRVFGGDDNRTLQSDKGAATTHPAAPSRDEVIANELAELDRRIQREPGLIEHRRDEAALLKSLDRVADARPVIARAGAAFPDNFWPPLALAALDLTPGSIQRFAAWAGAHPSFTHDYYLALLYRMAHDDAAATAAIQQALTQPIEVALDDPDILAFYLWDMSRFALERKNYPLVVQLTNAWEKASGAHWVNENSYLALRAAANLALGNDAAAQADLDLLDALKTNTWAQNLGALRSAVVSRDRAFHYDPGPMPASYPIFLLPQ